MPRHGMGPTVPPGSITLQEEEFDETHGSGVVMQRRGSSRGSVVLGFLLGFIVASLLAAVAVWLFRRAGGPRIDTSMPTVVRQIQQLQRLETVVFKMDKIISGGWESRFL